MVETIKSGRAWAWFGFALGIGASVSANVSHSYLVITANGGSNLTGALLSAAFWPLALFVCLEVMSRVRWPQGWVWWLVRYIGLSVVSAIAAVVSWRHMNGLLDTYGEDWFVAMIGPVAVDGLMVLCSAALLAIADNIKKRAAEGGGQSATPPAHQHYKEPALVVTPTLQEPPRSILPEKEVVNRIASDLVLTTSQDRPRPRRELPPPKKDDTKERNAEAVALYLKSVAEGQPMTGDQVGEAFGRSGRWGRDRIAEATNQPSQVL